MHVLAPCNDLAMSQQAVTTAVAHKLGLGSSIFAVSLAFSLVVMYDAANVRWHAGKCLSALTTCNRVCCIKLLLVSEGICLNEFQQQNDDRSLNSPDCPQQASRLRC